MPVSGRIGLLGFKEIILMGNETEKKMRLDKWLKVARIFKTRSKASDACEQGKVIVNEQPAKPAKSIKVGDTITVKFKWRKRTFDVLDISRKSLAADKARLLYREHELSIEEKQAEEQRELFFRSNKRLGPKFKGRPTKKDRRMINKIRGH